MGKRIEVETNPASWVVKGYEGPDGQGALRVGPANGDDVALVLTIGDTPSAAIEQYGRANLVSAAPELLDALTFVRPLVARVAESMVTHGTGYWTLLAMVDAAISKAGDVR